MCFSSAVPSDACSTCACDCDCDCACDCDCVCACVCACACREVSNHDVYAYESLGKHFEDSAWVIPTVAKAKEFRRRTLFEHGRAPICATRPADMMHMGAGVTLYL